jgi:hypothetical protein
VFSEKENLFSGSIVMMFCMKIDQYPVGKGSQNDAGDAKLWLEPQIEIERSGRTLSRSELNDAVKIAERNLDRLQEAWNAHKRQAE